MGFSKIQDFIWVLIWHKSEGKFSEGFSRQNGFGTLTLVASTYSVDLYGRTCTDTLPRGISKLSMWLRNSRLCNNCRVWDTESNLTLPWLWIPDSIVKSWDSYPPGDIMQGGD